MEPMTQDDALQALALDVATELAGGDDSAFLDPASIMLIIQVISMLLPVLKDVCKWDANTAQKAAQDVQDRKLGWRFQKVALRLMLRSHLGEEDFGVVRGREMCDSLINVTADPGSLPALQAIMD